jgi:hypothetical protein
MASAALSGASMVRAVRLGRSPLSSNLAAKQLPYCVALRAPYPSKTGCRGTVPKDRHVLRFHTRRTEPVFQPALNVRVVRTHTTVYTTRTQVRTRIQVYVALII